jgi:hypothetical protein
MEMQVLNSSMHMLPSDIEETLLQSVGVLSANLPRAQGSRLFGRGLPDLELDGKSEDTRHRFRQVRAARVV